MRSTASEWLMQAEYDFQTAQAMYAAGRYIYTLFMCHLAVEKVLKALAIEKTSDIPPKTHNLILLLKIVNPKLSDAQLDFLASLNAMSVTTRYPEDLSNALQYFTVDIASTYLDQTKEVLQCLKQGLIP